MNFALSQRRTHRHPVGLTIVVGLHVLLAASLLSARLKAPPAEPPPVNLEPLKPEVKVEIKTPDLPQPHPRQMTFRLEVPVPEVVPDRAEPTMVAAKVADRHDDPTPTIGKMEPPLVVAARATARPAVLDAGALGCRPAYPPAAQRAGATGVSKIRFTVDALGHVAAAQILQSSGPTREHRLMDKAAADALAACPVMPGVDESGRAVGGTADVDYVWKLN